MNKPYLLLVLLLLAFAGCDNKNIRQLVKAAAESPVDTAGFERREVLTNDYSAVFVDCFADVVYHQTQAGTPPRVLLMARGEVLENVRLTTRDGELRIELNRRYRMPEKEVAVVHLYSPFVSTFSFHGGKCLRLGNVRLSSPLFIDMSGVGGLTADTLEAGEIVLRQDGHGSLDVKHLSATRLEASLSGDGLMYLRGNCHQALLRLDGDGKIDTLGLKSELPIKFRHHPKSK